MLVIFAAFISGMIAFSLTKVINMEMLTVNQNTERILAQSLAVSEAEYIRSIKYQDLSLLVDRTFLPIRDSSYYKKYDISAEEDYTDKVKRRVVDISIYRNNIDDVPVFSIKVVRYYNGTGTTNSQI